MADVEEACFTGLSLGLGVDGYSLGNSTKKPKIERRDELCALSLGLYFSTCPGEEEDHGAVDRAVDVAGTAVAPGPRAPKNRRDSNGVVATGNIDCNNLDGCRRKLRLSKDQSALLEDSFKIHRTLTPAQKQALADKLNLKPRQVEVWFQNRRARSKLKQIELDFERIKKKCDSLIHRNQRLEKELHDIRSMKDDRSSLSVQLPDPNPAAFVLCSSCQKIVDGTAGRN